MEQQTDVFIPDGMNAFQRNVKRVGDCLIAFVALIVFSPLPKIRNYHPIHD